MSIDIPQKGAYTEESEGEVAQFKPSQKFLLHVSRYTVAVRASQARPLLAQAVALARRYSLPITNILLPLI